MIKTSKDYEKALDTLREASKLYYSDGSSLMNDSEFDELFHAVTAWEGQHGMSSDVTTRVAAGTNSGDVKHSVPMLSLSNIYDVQEIPEWVKRRTSEVGHDIAQVVTVEPKFDGSAVAITYEQGVPVRMITRGDGLYGKDITHNIDLLDGLADPSKVDFEFNGEIRGEVLMTEEQFEFACEERVALGKDAFKNPRNAAAGIIGTDKDKRTLQNTRLTFMAYDCMEMTPTRAFDSRFVSDHMRTLGTIGFNTPSKYSGIEGIGTSDIPDAVSKLVDQRLTFPFEIDGLVIKFSSMSLRNELGANSRAPRWAVAYKFPNMTATSTVREIITDIGKTGRISFKARIDPVDLMGVTIEYATLHNLDFISEHNIGVGATVQVERAADVIPRVSGGNGGIEYIPPSECPKCASSLVKEGAYLMCKSDPCNLPALLKYAISKKALDCDGAGEGFVDKVLETYPNSVTSMVEFFAMAEGDIRYIDGYSGRAGEKAYEALQEAFTRPFERLLIALALPGTGSSMSRRIAQHFGSLDEVRWASVEDLAEVDKMGIKKSQAVRDRLDELDDLLDDLIDLGFRTDTDTEEYAPVIRAEESPLLNCQVYFTGTTKSNFGMKKDEAERLVGELGGIWRKATPSTKLDYIIAGEATTKVNALVALGATWMNTKDFIRLAEQYGLR